MLRLMPALLMVAVAMAGCALGPCVRQQAEWTSTGSFAAVRDGPRPAGVTAQEYDEWVAVHAADGSWSLVVNATDGILFGVDGRRPSDLQRAWDDVAPAVGLDGVQAPRSHCSGWKGFPS